MCHIKYGEQESSFRLSKRGIEEIISRAGDDSEPFEKARKLRELTSLEEIEKAFFGDEKGGER